MQFFKDILSMNLADYGGADLPIGLILLFAFVGMIAATVVIQYTNAIVLRAVKALLRHKCTDPESAKTLRSLGLLSDASLLRALRRKNPMLMRYIDVVEGDAAQTASAGTEKKSSAAEAESTASDADALAEVEAKEKLSAPESSEAKSAAPTESEAECKTASVNTAIDAQIDPLTARLYLKPSLLDRAKELLSQSNASVLHTLMYCGVLLALYLLIAFLINLCLPLVL